MRTINRILYAALTVILAAFVFGCEKPASSKPVEQSAELSFASFRDIPGITESEIKAIENLQNQFDHFVYAIPPSTEAFINESGEIDGYSALLCTWLTSLFGIRFEPAIMEWNDILVQLKTGGIDFSNMTATEERLKTYFMTDSIAERSLKIMRIENSLPLDKILLTRPVRYAFLENSVTIEIAKGALAPGTYEIILAGDYGSIYNLIKSGNADAFIE